MFLVPIKLGTFKFSPYLILIVFLVPTKKKLPIILVLAKTNLFNYPQTLEILNGFLKKV